MIKMFNTLAILSTIFLASATDSSVTLTNNTFTAYSYEPEATLFHFRIRDITDENSPQAPILWEGDLSGQQNTLSNGTKEGESIELALPVTLKRLRINVSKIYGREIDNFCTIKILDESQLSRSCSIIFSANVGRHSIRYDWTTNSE